MNAPTQPDAPDWLTERFRSPIRVYVPSIGTVTGVPNDPDELAAVVWAEFSKRIQWLAEPAHVAPALLDALGADDD